MIPGESYTFSTFSRFCSAAWATVLISKVYGLSAVGFSHSFFTVISKLPDFEIQAKAQAGVPSPG